VKFNESLLTSSFRDLSCKVNSETLEWKWRRYQAKELLVRGAEAQ
jgi:hypothetical protein